MKELFKKNKSQREIFSTQIKHHHYEGTIDLLTAFIRESNPNTFTPEGYQDVIAGLILSGALLGSVSNSGRPYLYCKHQLSVVHTTLLHNIGSTTQ